MKRGEREGRERDVRVGESCGEKAVKCDEEC